MKKVVNVTYTWNVFNNVAETGEDAKANAYGRYLYTSQEYDVAIDLYFYAGGGSGVYSVGANIGGNAGYSNARVAGFYDAVTGTMITVDVFANGDANLYRYVSNDPMNATDPSGLWKISRDKSKRWATAVSEDGDTLRSLADEISLNLSEIGKWGKLQKGVYDVNGDKLLDTLENVLCEADVSLLEGCTEILIPNTVVTYTSKMSNWDGFVGFLAAITFQETIFDKFEDLVSAANKIDESKGFHRENYWQKSSVSLFRQAMKEDGIYKFRYVGHGTSNAELMVAPTEIGMSVVKPLDINLRYKLAELDLYACFSANVNIDNSSGGIKFDSSGNAVLDSSGNIISIVLNTTWLSLVSDHGHFFGLIGEVNKLNYPDRQWDVQNRPGLTPPSVP